MNIFLLLLSVSFVGIAHAVYLDDDDDDDDIEYAPKIYHRGIPEKTHLVTMRKTELMGIFNCVSDAIAAKDTKTCEGFSQCESMMASQVAKAYKTCRRAITGVSWTTCIPGRPLFTDSEDPEKIFDCVEDKTDVETPEERLNMVKFEQCSRKIRDQGCKYSSSLYDYQDIYDEDYYNFDKY